MSRGAHQLSLSLSLPLPLPLPLSPLLPLSPSPSFSLPLCLSPSLSPSPPQYGELVEFLCKCSFLEIYNEQVYDLLDPASCGLHLRENIKHGVYVDGLSEVSVSCARDAYEVLSTGWVNRKVASTSMNRESSRSHAVFTLTIESKKRVRFFKRFYCTFLCLVACRT